MSRIDCMSVRIACNQAEFALHAVRRGCNQGENINSKYQHYRARRCRVSGSVANLSVLQNAVSANRNSDMGIARFGRIYLAFWIVAGAQPLHYLTYAARQSQSSGFWSRLTTFVLFSALFRKMDTISGGSFVTILRVFLLLVENLKYSVNISYLKINST
jgi:hypothetical protein